MQFIYVYDETGFTGKFYGIDDSETVYSAALNEALDRMVDQETQELDGSEAAQYLDGYLYPVYDAYSYDGAERGYVAAADSPGYRHVTWQVVDEEHHLSNMEEIFGN